MVRSLLLGLFLLGGGTLAAQTLAAQESAAQTHAVGPLDGRPFDGKTFRGRIAYSADGNFNDEDDWAASAVALAIFAEAGVREKLVHFDYNCILPQTDPKWEQEHATSVIGAARLYGYSPSVFHDCRRNLDQAVASIRDAINASSADDPLYYILAGPMEVPYRGIELADPEKRKFVYCISHNVWNDGYASADLVNHNKRDVIPTGVTWIQIKDQNQFLTTSPFGRSARPDEWTPWHWMRDSADAKVRFLWERMRATTRADCSDAGMAYFLLSGDEDVEIEKLRALLADGRPLQPVPTRAKIRLEAENCELLDDFEVQYKNERRVSQRICVQPQASRARLQTRLKELYLPPGPFDVHVRYFGSLNHLTRFELRVNGRPQGDEWRPETDEPRWQTETVRGVEIARGDEIQLVVQGGEGALGRVDYLELAQAGPALSRRSASSRLQVPQAHPGQVVVVGGTPGYLRYNGGGPVFLAGPDNPEDFLFRGALQPDGTRTGGGQEEMIRRLAAAGVNAFHCQMFRMQRCNIKGEGDDSHAPFVDHDPRQPLNEAVLTQWDGWLSEFEKHGIIVHLEFYNDATDVETMGWTLQPDGQLHADERRWVVGVVNRFKHHKNIIWGLEESCNKLPRSRTPHFRKMAEEIARADNFHHPIVQSFVVPNDPEGDFPENGVTADDYRGDPHIQLVTWLHFVPHGDDFQKQHEEYLRFYRGDAANFIVLKNETFHHPKRGDRSRKYLWACAMTGMHCLEAYHHADTSSLETLADHGRLRRFMEQTEFYRMQSQDELAAADTTWVLADPGNSYVAYALSCENEMGIRDLQAGRYDLLWYDTVTGEQVRQSAIELPAGTSSFRKPAGWGEQLAIYLQRRD